MARPSYAVGTGCAMIILRALTGRDRRIYPAAFSFMAGVTPPMPMLGLSLFWVHSQLDTRKNCWPVWVNDDSIAGVRWRSGCSVFGG